jgi:hypothetical protein
MVAGRINHQPFDIIDELTIRQGQAELQAYSSSGPN